MTGARRCAGRCIRLHRAILQSKEAAYTGKDSTPRYRIVSEAEVNKEKLSELISIVDDATKSNNQKAQSIRKINGLAEVAVSLIGKLV
jgi:hypothetical protein